MVSMLNTANVPLGTRNTPAPTRRSIASACGTAKYCVMACARKMVDDQIGITRIADLSCSTWSTVHSRRPLSLMPSATPLPGFSSFVLLIMHALFKNLNTPYDYMSFKLRILEQQLAPLRCPTDRSPTSACRSEQ
uniref:Uncharacterized protein n=1 Tax=Leersia perrieri TaxID=77586 RepID=A0A0D9V5Z1_9ORYZ